mgnify:CR=1 FL=1
MFFKASLFTVCLMVVLVSIHGQNIETDPALALLGKCLRSIETTAAGQCAPNLKGGKVNPETWDQTVCCNFKAYKSCIWEKINADNECKDKVQDLGKNLDTEYTDNCASFTAPCA